MLPGSRSGSTPQSLGWNVDLRQHDTLSSCTTAVCMNSDRPEQCWFVLPGPALYQDQLVVPPTAGSGAGTQPYCVLPLLPLLFVRQCVVVCDAGKHHDTSRTLTT